MVLNVIVNFEIVSDFPEIYLKVNFLLRECYSGWVGAYVVFNLIVDFEIVSDCFSK